MARHAVFVALVMLAACSTNSEKRVPRAAAAAMTGSPWTLTAVSSLTIEGTSSGAAFQRVMNFKKGAGQHREAERSETLSPAERLHHPFGFVMAAFAANSKLGNTRTEGGAEAVDLTADGAVHTLYIDAQTKLPLRIVTAGNPAVETSFAKYVTIHGYHLPSRITRKVGSTVAWELNATRQIASADAVSVGGGEGEKRAAMRYRFD